MQWTIKLEFTPDGGGTISHEIGLKPTPTANTVDNSNALVAKDATGGAARYVACEDMQVCAADGRLHHSHDCVAGRLNFGFWTVFDRLQARSAVDQCFHEPLQLRGNNYAARATDPVGTRSLIA
jgi:hypothetical protein